MSSLPWFIDFIVQIPMQYCLLQHRTLLSPSDTFTAESFLLWPSHFILSGAISNCPAFFPSWRKKWQPTPVFLPGEPHGQRRLGGYSPQGQKCWTRLSWTPPLPIACWTSNLGGSPSSVFFLPFHTVHGVLEWFEYWSNQEYWSVLRFPLQWTVTCQNFSLWLVCLEWPCTAWLIASWVWHQPVHQDKAVTHEGKVKVTARKWQSLELDLGLILCLAPSLSSILQIDIFYLKIYHLFCTSFTWKRCYGKLKVIYKAWNLKTFIVDIICWWSRK